MIYYAHSVQGVNGDLLFASASSCFHFLLAERCSENFQVREIKQIGRIGGPKGKLSINGSLEVKFQRERMVVAINSNNEYQAAILWDLKVYSLECRLTAGHGLAFSDRGH